MLETAKVFPFLACSFSPGANWSGPFGESTRPYEAGGQRGHGVKAQIERHKSTLD